NQKFVQDVPVIMPGWDVAFFPEGGQLVAGLPNRVYCQVTTPGTKSAGVVGELLDETGKVFATVPLKPHQTKNPSHQLSGSFVFSPVAKAMYKLRVQLAKDAVTEKIVSAAVNS